MPKLASQAIPEATSGPSDTARVEPDWQNVLQFPSGGAAGKVDQVQGDPAGDPPARVVMSKEDFWVSFRFLFDLPNLKIKPPLESLPIAADDQQARKAADAIYDTCLEVAWLRWIIAPENEYVQRAAVIGVFFAGKGQMVRAELQERARARKPALDARAGAEPPKSAPEPPQAVNQPANEPGPAPDDRAAIGKQAA